MNAHTVDFVAVAQLPEGIEKLGVQARTAGYRFVDRLIDEFASGENRFAATGEVLFAGMQGDACLAVGGITRDPHGNPAVGRVRRVYVAEEARRWGLGRVLMQQLHQFATDHYRELQLFTDSAAAASFYESLGYVPCQRERVSHRWMIEPDMIQQKSVKRG